MYKYAQFLSNNGVYECLTRFHEIKNFRNLEFLISYSEQLEVYFEHPEIKLKPLIKIFDKLIVIQGGKWIKSFEEFLPQNEAIVLLPHIKGTHLDAFLYYEEA